MSDVINGVPRELLEKVIEDAEYGAGIAPEYTSKLRALLSAQPQASDEIPFAGFDPNFCPGSNPENPQTEDCGLEQASSAQSAPAGEREAAAYEHWKAGMEPYGFGGLDAFQAGAAWQRTQAAGVPDEVRDFLAGLRDGRFDLGTIWQRAADLLAAAPAQPAAQGEFGDAYQGAREDLAIWKRRALEAEARVRHQDQIIDQMGEDLNAINGPTFMGEPVISAAQDQGEVLTEHSGCGRGIQVDQLTVRMYPGDKVVMVRGRIGKALAASTGQEV